MLFTHPNNIQKFGQRKNINISPPNLLRIDRNWPDDKHQMTYLFCTNITRIYGQAPAMVRREPTTRGIGSAYFISFCIHHIHFMNHIGQIYHISKHSAMGWYWSSRVINKNLQDYESCKCSFFSLSPSPLPSTFYLFYCACVCVCAVLMMCVCQLVCCRYSHLTIHCNFSKHQDLYGCREILLCCWCLENKWIACLHFTMQFLWVII